MGNNSKLFLKFLFIGSKFNGVTRSELDKAYAGKYLIQINQITVKLSRTCARARTYIYIMWLTQLQ